MAIKNRDKTEQNVHKYSTPIQMKTKTLRGAGLTDSSITMGLYYGCYGNYTQNSYNFDITLKAEIWGFLFYDTFSKLYLNISDNTDNRYHQGWALTQISRFELILIHKLAIRFDIILIILTNITYIKQNTPPPAKNI